MMTVHSSFGRHNGARRTIRRGAETVTASGAYDREGARAVRDAANADPEAVCWLCGRRRRDNDPWVAIHGEVLGASGMLPAHRSCSSSAGGKLATRSRSRPEQW